jgi:tRNA-dihydrouridine synthase
MHGFWDKLKKPFSVLAPMADVTDVPFRSVIAACGRPDVFYTEFVSAHGLASAGRVQLLPDLALTNTDHPVVAQFFGTKPDHLFAAGTLARELGFDGVDINMGCPDKGVMKQGAGISLVKTPELARELIAALREGAGGLPVAVKTRLGLYKPEEMETWIGQLLEAKPDVLILHGRTMKEASKVPAHWDLIGRAAVMCHDAGVLCVGNGDVNDTIQGIGLCAQWGTDGYMVGRGIFRNPWLFAPHAGREHSAVQRLQLLLLHTDAWEKQWGGVKSFDLMKKFFKVYVSGWPGASHLRAQLMESTNAQKVRDIVARYRE